MGPTKKTARITGALYLLFVCAGLFSLMYVPGKLMVKGDAAATAANLLAHETLVRADLAVGLITGMIFLFIVLLLHSLLADVNRRYAMLMVILVLIQLPGAFVNQLLQLGALELARGTDFLAAIDQAQRETWAMLCLHLNSKSAVLSEFLWGVWLLPLAALVYRSGFLPRFLGIWLFLNGIAYVLMSGTGLLLPEYSKTVYNISLPALMGEVALMLWLLVMGIKTKPGSALTAGTN